MNLVIHKRKFNKSCKKQNSACIPSLFIIIFYQIGQQHSSHVIKPIEENKFENFASLSGS
jgi:hypothetical protein